MKGLNHYYIAGVVLCLLTIFFGGYYEFVSAFFAGVLSIFFLFAVLLRKDKCESVTDSFWFGLVLFLGYGISIFYAVDAGAAAEGFAKKSIFFVWGCFLLLLTKEERRKLLSWIPYIGAIMLLFCGIAWFVPAWKDYVFVQNRLSGWFQYANTCGGFLLAGTLVVFQKEHKRNVDYILFVILLGGILLTGSRSTMLLLILAFVYFFIKKSAMRKWLIIGGGSLFAIIAGFALFTGNTANIARITTLFTSSSTIYGRALYNFDGMTQLLKKPFGMGYLGFYYIQNKIQTGHYSVRYIHNDWLQIGLDIGLVPMLLILVILIKNLWNMRKNNPYFIVLLVLVLQGCMEFNIEYSVIGLVIMLCLEEESLQVIPAEKLRRISTAVCAMAVIPLFYISIPLALAYGDYNRLALQFYPWETNAKLAILSEVSEEEEAERLAEEILEQNETCSLAYDALAVVAVNEARYEDAVAYMKKSIEYNRFEPQGYEQLEWLLQQIVEQEVVENTEYYLMEYDALQTLKEENRNAVSYFGKKIRDKVELP